MFRVKRCEPEAPIDWSAVLDNTLVVCLCQIEDMGRKYPAGTVLRAWLKQGSSGGVALRTMDGQVMYISHSNYRPLRDGEECVYRDSNLVAKEVEAADGLVVAADIPDQCEAVAEEDHASPKWPKGAIVQRIGSCLLRLNKPPRQGLTEVFEQTIWPGDNQKIWRVLATGELEQVGPDGECKNA